MVLELDNRSILGLLLSLATLALAGCGNGGSVSAPTKVDPESVRVRSEMYSLYLATHKFQPPKDEADFRQFLSSEQARLEKAGLTIEDMFVSPRNGEPMRWVFGKRPPVAGGISVFAYESDSADGQRLLMGDRGMYILMDDAEFKQSFPQAP